MHTSISKNNKNSETSSDNVIVDLYTDAVGMLERLHRSLLEVVKDELDRRNITDINSVQALMIYHMSDEEITAGELRTRGYYQGSNVSYNLKKLVDMGYIEHNRSRIDRRTVRVKLSDKGQEIRSLVLGLYLRQANNLEPVGEIKSSNLIDLINGLNKLERFWADHVRFRM